MSASVGRRCSLYVALAILIAVPAGVFAQTATVTGTIRNAANAPVAGISVSVWTADARVVATGTTDSAGSYSIPGVASGTYYLKTSEAAEKGFFNVCYNARPCAYYTGFWLVAHAFPTDIADPVVLAAGQTFVANFQLQAGATIRGRVILATTREPVAGAIVTLADAAGWATEGNPGGTDSQGFYSRGGLSPGQYMVTVAKTGTVTQTTKDPVTIAAGQTRTGIDFEVAPKCDFSTSPSYAIFSAAGGAGKFSITATAATCPWTATASDDFITITSDTHGTGNGTLTFSVPPLLNGTRGGKITIGSTSVRISQIAGFCDVSLANQFDTFDGAGGNGTVRVTTRGRGILECSWTAVSNSPFLKILSDPIGRGPGTLSYTVEPFPNGTRTGTLTIGGRTLVVVQTAKGCTFTVSPSAIRFEGPGGTGTVSVKTSTESCTWTAASNKEFVSFNEPTSRSGTGDATFAVAALATGTRTGSITVADQTITITQALSGCAYSVTPANTIMGRIAGTLKIDVSTGPGCSWTAATNDPPIATIVSGASGNGPGAVTVAVESNEPERFPGFIPGFTQFQARQATIEVAGQRVVITQKGDPVDCSEELRSDSDVLALEAAEGTGAFEFTSYCRTLPVSDSRWVVIGETNDSTSRGKFSFRVAANTTGVERTAHILAGSFVFTVTQSAFGRLTVDRASLAFTVARSAGGLAPPATRAVTPAQAVRVGQRGGRPVTWTVGASQPWLVAVPDSGSGPGQGTFKVKVLADAGWTPGPAATGIVTVKPSDGTSSATVSVTVQTIDASASRPPFGAFDTPASGPAPLQGSVAVTGWALDDVGVKRVELWRDVQPGEPTPPFTGGASDPRNGKIFIANATFVDGARPDVEPFFPTTPANYRAGWGYLLLTWGLFGQGNGTFTLYAFAFDEENNVTMLGAKTVPINNNSAARPFGAIDTPEIGGSATGPNFGWALTPKVNGAATCRIPSNGVQVSIDSGPLQGVVYGDARTDVAGTFPGFSNTSTAGAHFIYDWSTLTAGVHTIGWFVTDDCNRADGIGSRVFTVATGTSVVAAETPGFRLKAETTGAESVASALRRNGAAEEASALRRKEIPVLLARGYGELPEIVDPGPDGTHTIEVKQGERIEIRMPRGFESAYQLGPSGQRRALPIGSTWDGDAGTFYWQPAPAFLGTYQLGFSNGRERISVGVVVRSGDR